MQSVSITFVTIISILGTAQSSINNYQIANGFTYHLTSGVIKVFQNGLPLNKFRGEHLKLPGNPIVYSLGQCNQALRLVKSLRQPYSSWSEPDPVSLLVDVHPVPGVVVKCVQVFAFQSNDRGFAQVIHGGIGRQTIGLQIVADSTTFFGFIVDVYGP